MSWRVEHEKKIENTKLVETTIVSIKKLNEDIDTITLRFMFANKTSFTQQFQKHDLKYIYCWKKKKPGDKIYLIVAPKSVKKSIDL